MSTYAARVNLLWTTALQALGIAGRASCEPPCRTQCGRVPVDGRAGSVWVDRVRLAAPR